VFTAHEARALGWTESSLRRAVNSGRLTRLRRGIFASADASGDPILRAVAAARSCFGSVVSHRSAALLHGLPLLGPPPVRPDLTVPPNATGDTSAALLHRAKLRPHDVVHRNGTAVTSVARTLADYARVSTLWAAVVCIDHARRHGLVSMDELRDVWRMCKSWPGGKRIEPAVALSTRWSESPLESCSRLALGHHGVPTPELQAEIRGLTGRFLGRTDFYWDEQGVVGEADGQSKYVDRDVLTAEKFRQERLEEAGLVVVRWGWDDLRHPADLAARVKRALARGQRQVDAQNFPRLWSAGVPVSPRRVG
jgi:hypothetical protein